MFASAIQARVVRDRGRHPVGVRGRVLVAVAMALVGSLSGLVSASSAVAEPTGIFKVFEECPRETRGILQCLYDRITGGEFSIGSARIPIDKTLMLQVGNISAGNPENEAEYFGVPAKNGESLSKTELNVPLDLFGVGVTVSPELVTSKEHQLIINEFALSREEGAGLTLPLRFHLKSPFLGESCYIGSGSEPLQLRLTTGETHPPKGFSPLHGKLGTISGLQENEHDMLHLAGMSLVDNTFSLPGAEGCGGSFDSIIDEKLKLPNEAGENTAILDGEMDIVGPEELIASESWTVAPVFALPAPGGLPASNVTQLTATLNGTLNPGGAPDAYHFEYGTTTAYGSFAPIPESYTPSTSETLTVSQPVAGLQAGTTYHYRVVADNPEGLRVLGPDETFTTLPIPAPTMETGGTSGTSGIGVLTATPGSGATPTAGTPPASSSTPPAHHTLNARRRVKKRAKKHKSTKKHAKRRHKARGSRRR